MGCRGIEIISGDQGKTDGPRSELITQASTAPEEVAWQQVDKPQKKKNEGLLGHCPWKLLEISG